ncbi:MAG TPA: TRL domain-containing protein [Leptospiraceae bacterium]|nr:TRL domain-containing protein [Leptospiraceae bacterium]
MLVILILFSLIGCASGPVGGLLFTNYEYSGEVNPDSSIPLLAEAKGCQFNLLGLFSIGDSSAGQIANNVGIRRIATIDHSTISILHILFVRNCTIITGATY